MHYPTHTRKPAPTITLYAAQVGPHGVVGPDSDPATGDTLAAGCGPSGKKGKEGKKKGDCVVS